MNAKRIKYLLLITVLSWLNDSSEWSVLVFFTGSEMSIRKNTATHAQKKLVIIAYNNPQLSVMYPKTTDPEDIPTNVRTGITEKALPKTASSADSVISASTAAR